MYDNVANSTVSLYPKLTPLLDFTTLSFFHSTTTRKKKIEGRGPGAKSGREAATKYRGERAVSLCEQRLYTLCMVSGTHGMCV